MLLLMMLLVWQLLLLMCLMLLLQLQLQRVLSQGLRALAQIVVGTFRFVLIGHGLKTIQYLIEVGDHGRRRGRRGGA